MIKTWITHNIIDACLRELLRLPNRESIRIIELYDVDAKYVCEMYLGNFNVVSVNDCPDAPDEYYYYDTAISGKGIFMDLSHMIYETGYIDKYSIYQNYQEMTIKFVDVPCTYEGITRYALDKGYMDLGDVEALTHV